MLNPWLLLLVAVGLLLYATHELAPTFWASAMGRLRQRLGAALGDVPLSAARAETLTEPASSLASAHVPVPSRLLALWVPLVIVALALVLRVIDLTGSPFGFFCDEASNGLDAYGIVHTLHDQHGAFLPVYFEALEDWRGGFHIYWEVPFVAAFGLTEFAVRLGSAVAGTLTVGLTYLFVTRALNRPVGLIAAFLLAMSPWHLIVSRIGFEFVSLPFVTALCLALLYIGLQRQHWLPLGIMCGALGMYTYQPARVFFPLLLLIWSALYLPRLWTLRRYALIGLVGAAVLLIPTAVAVGNGTFFARANQLSTPGQSTGARLAMVWTNYLAHYSPDFLFNTSTDIILRHYVRGFGMLFGVEAPFLIVGVLVMLWRHRRPDLLFLAWAIIYPIGTALASMPLSTRSIAGVIVAQVFVAQGLYSAGRGVAWLARRAPAARPLRPALTPAFSLALVLGGLLLNGTFMHAYLVDYPTYSSQWWGWQSGYKQITAYFEREHAHYAALLMDNEANAPDELLRFYTATNPAACANCAIADSDNPADIQRFYTPGRRELWAVAADKLAISPIQRLQGSHTVGHLTIPGGAPSWYFIATGPGA
jgi:4-amino-4-deoxy-L-arabinose transferase-like glycosyltransferase